MRNTWIVAITEFSSIVRTKAFIVSLMILPIMMGISVGLQSFVAQQERDKPFRMAVIDHTNTLYQPLVATVAVVTAASAGSLSAVPHIELSLIPVDGPIDQIELRLSEQIRNKDLEAFLELPAELLQDPPPADAKFYLHVDEGRSGVTALLEGCINQLLFFERLKKAGVSEQKLGQILKQTKMEQLGLVKKDLDGTIKPADKIEGTLGVVLPMILMVILFVLVMMSTQPLLSTVLEEKMSRISEVLLGMVNPFELMMGKLLGSLGASLLLALLYVGTGIGILAYMGYLSLIPPISFVYLLLFLFPAVFLFGSTYLAIGAACNDFKDAQTLLTPFMLILTMPMIMASLVLNDPNGPLSTALSLFPPATPYLMLLRISLRPGPPLWQVPLSLALTFATSFGIVFMAGRIFRTGLLMQGKAPSIKEMIRWALVR